MFIKLFLNANSECTVRSGKLSGSCIPITGWAQVILNQLFPYIHIAYVLSLGHGKKLSIFMRIKVLNCILINLNVLDTKLRSQTHMNNV